MAEYKEIVTKAVIAKGKKSTSNKYTLEPEEIPNTILGCWVINNTFNGTSVGDSIIVNGSFDVNEILNNFVNCKLIILLMALI